MYKRYLFLCIFILLIISFVYSDETSFDNIQWKKEAKIPNLQKLKYYKKISGIQVFSYSNKEKGLHYYKAVSTVKDIKAEDIYENLLDFDKYQEMFLRSILFEVFKDMGNGKYIMYSQLDFSPYESRDCYTELKHYVEDIENNKKRYVIEWNPAK